MKKIMSIIISVAVMLTAALPLSVSAENSTNPVIKGSFADPDIDVFGCKYWIFPTTDGNPGWSGTQFHAFSSENLTDWTDEGVILDVENDNPSLNEKGIQIAASKWSCGNAWAPAIEEKNGKYYFYYCGRIKPELMESYGYKDGEGNYMGDKAIGVAVADAPQGPYTALDTPLLYPKMIAENPNLIKAYGGQVIDPSIFTDDDGSSYILFGNGNAYMYRLGDDMQSVVDSSLRQLNLQDFRESVVLFKRDGVYHYTWSCDDTASVNYHVNYGTASGIDTKVNFKYTIIEKNENESIFGTGHQCTLYIPETDECYIAYGRHQTKDGVSVDDAGNFREVCITKLHFDSLGKLLEPAVPTNSVTPAELHKWQSAKVLTKATCKSTGVMQYSCSKCGKTKTQTIPVSSSHSAVTDKAVSPTFAKTGLTAGSHCSVCGKVLTKQKVVAKLVPSATSLSKVTAASKAFTVKWKKQTKNTTGYQIQYSTSSKFKSAKTVTVKSNKTTSVKVKKLKSKKKYFVRIRTYKQVGSKKYYSTWSKSKSITTKK